MNTTHANAAPRVERDYSAFDAELTGAALNLKLLGRLMRWMKPYRFTFGVSAVLILVMSALQVLMPIVISLVVIDGLIEGEASERPDFGMHEVNDWLTTLTGLPPLMAACLLYTILQLAWALTGHWHRMTLITSVINGLRDLRADLFSHLETRPFSFYDRVAVGRVMTRVTNDVEALYELLRGVGTLIGEFVPFFVALTVMLAMSVELTLMLLLALPVVGGITWLFRRATSQLFRLVRMTLSALNQNMHENLAGLQIVQLSVRETFNLDRYDRINRENRDHELKSARLETLYGAFTDSMAHVAIGVVIWYGGGEVIQQQMTLGEVVLFTQFIGMLFNPIVVLGEQTNILFRAMASGERIFQALDWDEKIHEPAQPAPLPKRLRGDIEFRNVHFAYHDTPVLKVKNSPSSGPPVRARVR
jgi:ATP-binding cassette, subfamily B, multidrug efflux pump